MIKSLLDSNEQSNDEKISSTASSSEERTSLPGFVKKSVEEVSKKAFDEETTKSLRESGLAWSAAIALFASVVFMMAIGWIIDTLLETAPLGIVVGIIFGALIGFYQFFRITSQIFK
ncbi:MAG: AtpZ/AtpI family protein [Pyrinomonadaceae bacterium]|nr:AtpZ/AtpI family protein [Pyrinomonadaceae bacterium]MCX7640781.1 AtpZ/AtpI family protein [Pyrinomonadaceae bacterium]MDW8304677.1 AtpZ/AtpI family protein [Acidobacteriota bacterium]